VIALARPLVAPRIASPARRPGHSCPASARPIPERTDDQEVRRLVEEAQDEVTQLLIEHRDQLDSLSRGPLESETLDAINAYRAAGVTMNNQRSRSPVIRWSASDDGSLAA
jgi:hypothetical protein